MNIVWHGQSCFTIKSKDRTVVVDPYKDVGLKEPKLQADIVLVSHDHHDHNNVETVSPVKEEFKLINSPGEYEYQGVSVQAVPAWHDDKQGKEGGETLMFAIRLERMVVGHLGDLGQPELSEKQLEELNGVDILLVPVGGKYTIGSDEASKVIDQLEPGIVIPMHYKIEGLNIDIADAGEFLKEEGAKNIEPKDELKIEKKGLPQEEREVVILKPKTG